jgi:glycosyltransferase involved in cell wall biosynthesis
MKLYIDGLFYKGSGIGRYYESLTKEFAKREIKIYTCIPKNLRDSFEDNFKDVSKNIESIYVDYEKFSGNAFFEQSKILKKIEREVDLFFFPHINLPFNIPKKTVITIHDLIPLKNIWDRNEIERGIYLFYLKRALKSSKNIISISNTIENELKNIFHRSNRNIEVIYEFIDDKFTSKPISEKRIIKNSYLLFIGNRKKHKNLELLIKAFAIVKNQIPQNLVIAGGKDREKDEIDYLIQKLKLENRVIQLIKPNDETIINLYSFANLFVFPSLFEGFGLPPLEAVNLDCPVILSDIPILQEIFGNAGLYFNPYSENELAEAIIKVILDDNLRSNLLEKQKQRSKIFDKDKIINQYIRLFENIKNEK